MKYRVTCLTPTLVGDGQRLSPIDYMVWKEHVNVLDQRRIFKLLAKGPRLEGYLSQIRKAEKLDFANWGGFAQNFAGRRITFEDPALAAVWEKQRAEALFIPTFAAGPAGPYLPASALRGALHTALLFHRWQDVIWERVQQRIDRDKDARRLAEPAEEFAIGLGGSSRMRSFGLADTAHVAASAMKVYLLRTANLVERGGRFELAWKTSSRGNAEPRRVDESAAVFCEMASPGTVFEGDWFARKYLANPEMLRALRWKEPVRSKTIMEAANAFSACLLAIHRRYASLAGLKALDESLGRLESRLEQARASSNSCLLAVGWGTGFLSKTGHPETDGERYRKLLRQLPPFSGVSQSGRPFPKTRRVVFLAGQPAALPGWVHLEMEDPAAD